MTSSDLTPPINLLYEKVAALIAIARQQVRTQVNPVRVMTYWQIGRMQRFYLAFEKRDALRLDLSWTHDRLRLAELEEVLVAEHWGGPTPNPSQEGDPEFGQFGESMRQEV